MRTILSTICESAVAFDSTYLANVSTSHRFILAGCQLNQVSKGKMLVDLARPDDVQTFWKDIVALFAAVSDKKDDEL